MDLPALDSGTPDAGTPVVDVPVIMDLGATDNGVPVCPADQVRCGGACVPPIPNFVSDPNNCGGCGRVCLTGAANTAPTCTAGVCGFVCNAGFFDCDRNASNVMSAT